MSNPKLRLRSAKPVQQEVEHHDQPKPFEQIYDEQLDEGLREYRRGNTGLFVSALLAGLEIGFSLYLMGVLHTMLKETASEAALALALAMAYPLGFIFVVLGKSELFTEHTVLSVLPVLNGRKTTKDLLKIWGIIYSGNLIGGSIMALILVYIGTAKGIIEVETFMEIGRHFTEQSTLVVLGSAVLAGWLMGLLSWLVTSSQETISRIVIIILITGAIGLGTLHHCIVGSVELLAAVLSSEAVHFSDYLRVQVTATVGNIIGGVFFVALFKYKATITS